MENFQSRQENVSVLIDSYLDLNNDDRSLFLKLLVIKLEGKEIDLLVQIVQLRGEVKDEANNRDDDLPMDGYVDYETIDNYTEKDIKDNLESCEDKYEEDSNQPEDLMEDVKEIKEETGGLGNNDGLTKSKKVSGVLKKKKREGKSKKTTGKTLTCDKCLKSFSYTKRMENHTCIDSVLPSFYCEHCPKVFTKKSKLKSHRRMHTGEKPYTCNECNKTFSQQSNLKNHMRSHTGVKTFLCDQCDKKYTHSHQLKRHVKTVHLNIRDKECPHCDYKTHTSSSLKIHVDGMHKNTEVKEICPYCGVSFKYVQAHIRQIHTEIEKKMCHLCEFSANVQSQVDRHILKVHQAEGQTCPTCGKMVKDLKRHFQRGCITSSQEKKHHCLQCDKRFKQKIQLERHIKTVHLNIRDQECPHCNYKTTTGFNLKIHVSRVHEGKQLRKECEFCGKKVYSLEWHVYQYHKTAKLKQDNENLMESINGINRPKYPETTQNLVMDLVDGRDARAAIFQENISMEKREDQNEDLMDKQNNAQTEHLSVLKFKFPVDDPSNEGNLQRMPPNLHRMPPNIQQGAPLNIEQRSIFSQKSSEEELKLKTIPATNY